jgi:hypothetical protein
MYQAIRNLVIFVTIITKIAAAPHNLTASLSSGLSCGGEDIGHIAACGLILASVTDPWGGRWRSMSPDRQRPKNPAANAAVT